MRELIINDKIALDLEAIKATEYASQLFNNENRENWIVCDVLFAHGTVSLRPTKKSRIEIIVPMHFIKKVA